MARTTSGSRSQSARARAREAMAAELERARKRQDRLAAAFTALDARADADRRAGQALAALRDLGESNGSIAELTGLGVREVGALLRLAGDTDGEDRDDADTGAGDDDPQSAGESTAAASGF